MRAILPVLALVMPLIIRAQVTQPLQPAIGPGGSQYTNSSVTQYDYGTNANGDGFWLYEPAGPVPDSANVVVFIHGMGETNPKLYGGFIKHLVRKGNIVIYPRYQQSLTSNTNNYNDSCARGIQRALDTLKLAGHVKPRLENYFILGHSVGGLLTANMTMMYNQYSLPKPLASFSIEPGGPGLAGLMLSDYSSFPDDVKYLVLIGHDDIIVGTSPGTTLYNATTAVPTDHKNLVELFADNHGSPAVGATHMEPLANDDDFDNGETNTFIALSGTGPIDAVDFYCTWKLQDALMDCALRGENCDVAFGDTPKQKFMGLWSDSTPITPLVVTPVAVNSLNSVAADAIFSIYPNPNDGSFTVELKDMVDGKGTYFEMIDIAGRKVFEQRLTAPQSKISASLEKGIYLYSILNGEGTILKNGKMVLQ